MLDHPQRHTRKGREGLPTASRLVIEIGEIVAAFDIDPHRIIGRVSEKLGKPVEILHSDTLREVVRERNIEIGIITTPADQAQKVADQLVEADVRGILNFAPAQIEVPEGYIVKNVFFTTVLDNLAYLLSV